MKGFIQSILGLPFASQCNIQPVGWSLNILMVRTDIVVNVTITYFILTRFSVDMAAIIHSQVNYGSTIK